MAVGTVRKLANYVDPRIRQEIEEHNRRCLEESGPVTISYVPRAVDIARCIASLDRFESIIAAALADGATPEELKAIPGSGNALRSGLLKLMMMGLIDKAGRWLSEEGRKACSQAAGKFEGRLILSPQEMRVADDILRRASGVPMAQILGVAGAYALVKRHVLRMLAAAGIIAIAPRNSGGTWVRLLMSTEEAKRRLVTGSEVESKWTRP